MSKLWGTRFTGKSDSLADQFSYSISYDYRLAPYDVKVSIAHARMLGKCKIIPTSDATKIVAGLKKIGNKLKKGTFKFDPNAEDIHTNIQAALKKDIGSAADKLHTARSRNDLIVTDMKLYCMDHITQMIQLIRTLQRFIVKFAQKHTDVIIPAYTHLQPAQVVLLSHHMLAYVEMLERDKSRLKSSFKRMDSLPLGSGALSGTSLPIDRKMVANELGFLTITNNSMDSVADRDFIVEVLSDLAILGTHFSRIAEDMIILNSDEFNRISIDDAYCTGSSIMPHKKNPDMFELIRGESAKLISNVNEILVLLKGLPLTYNRDLQLDKPPLFESVEKAEEMTLLMARIFESLTVTQDQKAQLTFNTESNESLYSVDIVDYLINKGASYRAAHDIVGKMCKDMLKTGVNISELNNTQLKKYSSLLSADVKKLLNPTTSVKIKKSSGSTNPRMVDKQLRDWKKYLAQN